MTSPNWRIEYYIRGQRHNESVNSANRADATRLLKQRIGEAQTGRPVGPQIERTTLEDLIAMVEDDYKVNGRSSADRIGQAANHLRAFFNSTCKAGDITGDRIARYQRQRLEDGAKPSTVNYEVALLRRGFRLATRAGKVGMRPEFAMLHVENVRKGFFEYEQFQRVLDRLPEYHQPVFRC